MKAIFTEFIEKIAPSLPQGYWGHTEYIFVGEELLMCGHKVDGDGVPINPKGLYPMKGPAYIHYPAHDKAMRRAFLSQGKTGILKYLEKFIEPAEMQGFRELFLSA